MGSGPLGRYTVLTVGVNIHGRTNRLGGDPLPVWPHGVGDEPVAPLQASGGLNPAMLPREEPGSAEAHDSARNSATSSVPRISTRVSDAREYSSMDPLVS